jgi:DNA-binding NarL/FixJ family response regulator
MTDRSNSIVVAVQSSSLRKSIVAFLRNLSGVKVLTSEKDFEGTYISVKRNLPSTLVIDANLCNLNLAEHIQRLLNEAPKLNCIVLVDSLDQQSIAESAGAKYALLKGMLSEPLMQAIKEYSSFEAEVI